MRLSIKSILTTILLITAIMLIIMMTSMVAISSRPAYATEVHSHKLCGMATCEESHPEHLTAIEYTPLTAGSFQVVTINEYEKDKICYYLNQGNYYLQDDFAISSKTTIDGIDVKGIFIKGTVNLCLNGKTFNCQTFSIDTDDNVVFNICDCDGSNEQGAIVDYKGSNASIVARENTHVNIYGGTIKGSCTAGDKGYITVYGGIITKSSNVLRGSGTQSYITINGGKIESTSDIAIVAYNHLNINGGKIISPKTAIKIDKPTISEPIDINITGGKIVGNPALHTVFEVRHDVDRETRRINITGGKLTNYNDVGSEVSVIKIDNGYVHISKGEIEMPYDKSTPATCIVVSGQGNLTIDPENDDDVLINSQRWGIYVRNLPGGPSGGRVTINGGKFITLENCMYVESSCNISSVTINDGYFESETQGALLCGSRLYVNGGTFSFKSGKTDAQVITSTEFLSITGAPTINGIVRVQTTGKYTENTPNRYYFDITGYTGESIIKLSLPYAMLNPTHNQAVFAGAAEKVAWNDNMDYELSNSYDDDLDLPIVVFKHKAHSGGTPTCTEKATCTVCATQYGDLVAHTEGTPATCTSLAVCEVCAQTYGDMLPHTYQSKYDSVYHWEGCTECDSVINKAMHNGGVATCTALAQCVDCLNGYGATLPHNYGTVIKDDSYHWHDCQDCGALSTKTAHTYGEWSDYVDNGDGTKTKTAKCSCDKAIGITIKVTVAEINKSFEQECIERGTTLEMSVVADSASITEESKSPIQEQVTEAQSVVYFDITILDTIANQSIGNTNNVLEIPVSFETTNRGEFVIYRNHNGRVDKFTLLESRPTDNYVDGTYYVEDGVIYIYTSQFSTYAVAYQDAPVALVVGLFAGLLVLVGVIALVLVWLARTERKRLIQLANAYAEQECQKLFKRETHLVTEEDANQKALDWVKQHFWNG